MASSQKRSDIIAISGTQYDQARESVFPLPVLPFEHMMLLDNSESHPMTCRAEFTFEGHFERDRLEVAYRMALQRHPLLRANIRRRLGRLVWIAGQQPTSIEWLGSRERPQRPPQIDLRTEPGLRLCAVNDTSGTTLYFDFHHACIDGVGGLGFFEELLQIYSHLLGDHGRDCGLPLDCVLPRLDKKLLRRRGKFERGNWLSLSELCEEAKHLIDTVRFFSRQATPLAAGLGAIRLGGSPDECHIISRTFDSDQLLKLRHRAAALSVTVNDVVAQALMLTIRDWNHDRSGIRGSERLRLVIPVNLRSRSDLEMPAANRTGYAFLERTAAEMEDVHTFLQSLNSETSRIRRTRMAERTLARLGALAATGAGLKFALSRQRCLATAVLSSVGDPTRRFRSRFPRERGQLVAGNVMLTGLTAVTPIRPFTRASFFLNTYASQLNVGAQLDPKWFGPLDGDRFLDQLAGHLELEPAAGYRVQAA